MKSNESKPHFGTRLDAIRIKLDISVREFAERCGLGYTYMTLLISGKRRPTLETLCKIAYGLKMEFIDIVMLLPSEIYTDESGKQCMSSLFPDNGRGPHSKNVKGKLVMVNETFLRQRYTDFKPDKFKEFFRRYVQDAVYCKGEYEEFVAKRNAEVVISHAEVERPDERAILREIVVKLSAMDDSDLEYFNDMVEIYSKHCKNKR